MNKSENQTESKKDTKLIAFLKTFSKPELSEFEKFLKSPYFKKERDPLPLFNYLKKHYPGFPSEKINEENILTELYPGESISNKKYKDLIRNISSTLLKAVTDFIFYSGIKNDVQLKNRTILRGFLDRNLIKYYEQYLTESYNYLSLMNQESATAALECFQLEQINTRYFAYTLQYKKFLDHGIKSLEWNSAHFILNLIWTAKIKYLEETYNGAKPDNNFPDKLFEALDIEKAIEAFSNHQKYPEILFNYYTYKSIINGNDLEYYRKAKDIFIPNKVRISRFEKNFFYADLINILSSGKGIGTEYKRKELFEIMRYCVEDKAYKVSEEDFMHPSFYRSAVIHSVAEKEFDWAEKFIENYTGELQKEYADNMKYFTTAVVKFGRRDFEESLKYISKVKYDFVRLKTDVKFLMLKIYYELNLEDPAYCLIDTFKHYASDSKEISEDTRISVKNFLKYYSQLFKIKNIRKSAESGFVKDSIEKEEFLYHKDWLYEKINELI
ncbi:MAG: hypothetical protein WBQ38_12535 [Ignavibacteria bacterium]